jgi:hypothetical protein
MNLTLGVHGPKFVHAILFDDTPPDYENQFRPSDFFEPEFSDSELSEAGFSEPGSFDEENDEAGGFDDEEHA